MCLWFYDFQLLLTCFLGINSCFQSFISLCSPSSHSLNLALSCSSKAFRFSFCICSSSLKQSFQLDFDYFKKFLCSPDRWIAICTKFFELFLKLNIHIEEDQRLNVNSHHMLRLKPLLFLHVAFLFLFLELQRHNYTTVNSSTDQPIPFLSCPLRL